jgi:hypothetical protein
MSTSIAYRLGSTFAAFVLTPEDSIGYYRRIRNFACAPGGKTPFSASVSLKHRFPLLINCLFSNCTREYQK